MLFIAVQANEGNVVVALRSLRWVKQVYQVGLLRSKELPFAAVSADGLAWIVVNGALTLCGVEMKTRSGTDALRNSYAIRNQLNSPHLIVDLDSPILQVLVPESDYRYQIAHQMVVLNLDTVLFVIATEGQICYTVTVKSTAASVYRRQVMADLRRLDSYMNLSLIHTEGRVPEIVPAPYQAIWRTNLTFWTLLKTTVATQGLLGPVKEFLHIMQALYSKNKVMLSSDTQ